MRVHRESADPERVGSILHELGFQELDLLPTKRFTQPDMAFALSVSPITYENYERLVKGTGKPTRRMPVDKLLLFGKLCGLNDVEELDRLWSEARGTNFPRTSNLVGLDVPDELRDLIVDDTSDIVARAETRRASALRGAALRVIAHGLQNASGADPNPYTAAFPEAAATLARAFAQDHVRADVGGDVVMRAVRAVEVSLRPTMRDWVDWELRRLDTTPAPRRP
ncbi:hypothetical protein AB0C96_35700 [Streptomyces sp. NPDC048506]|uniref:hypothetical protein n=1 Tax=Streptomyces sp. NPDC048506 TaxID=3155028 RepID=UPI00344A62E5